MTIRVLLADPDETLLETYQAFLQRQGFEIRGVTTGESCLATLRSFTPHVLVLEPELPGSWGTRILTHLREDCPTPLPVVIVLTRHEVDLGRFRIHTHHLKPYSMHDLATRIREAAATLVDQHSQRSINATQMP